MEKRPNAVTFKGNPITLVGPALAAGDKAPPFNCLNGGLEVVTLDKTPAMPRLFSVVPSLDTPTCSLQTKKFDEALNGWDGKLACYTVSLDLPFAQKRFCTSEGVAHMQTLSDVHNHSFGKNWGVLLEGLPMALLTRAVFVVNKDGVLTYVQVVPEVTAHPDYDAALKALEAAAGIKETCRGPFRRHRRGPRASLGVPILPDLSTLTPRTMFLVGASASPSSFRSLGPLMLE